MLEIRNLNVSLGGVHVLRSVELQIPSGEIAGLIGRNGAGKTTLMRSVMGLTALENGSVHFADQDLEQLPAFKRAHFGIGYMPEDRRLVPDLTVEENILLPVWATQKSRPYTENRLQWIYELMPEVRQFAERRALQLSGGQQKLVALARALICGTELLLLDEPFEGVAPVLARRLVEVIHGLKDAGATVLLSESDYTHSADLLDHLFVIERGVVQEQKEK